MKGFLIITISVAVVMLLISAAGVGFIALLRKVFSELYGE